MLIKYHLEVGYCGCDDEGVINIPSDREHEIDNIVNDLAMNWAEQWVGDTRLMDEEEWEENEENFWGDVGGSWEIYDETIHGDGWEIENL